MVAKAVLPCRLKAASATERSSHNLCGFLCLCKCLLVDTVNKVVKLSQVKTNPEKKGGGINLDQLLNVETVTLEV